MGSEKKSYYAVIPADVRYDKKLTPNAKLLYGEITALCNEKGFCWASNNYFAKLYNVKPQAISRWIKSLEECKYIEIEYIYKGKEITQRKVSINSDTYQQINKGVSIESEEGINKSVTGYQQNDKENNTINNTINNKVNTEKQKTKKFVKPTIQEIKEYAEYLKYKGFDSDRFFYYYESNGWVQNRNKPIVDWKSAVRSWELNSKRFNPDKKEKQACPKCGAYMSNGKCPRCDDV